MMRAAPLIILLISQLAELPALSSAYSSVGERGRMARQQSARSALLMSNNGVGSGMSDIRRRQAVARQKLFGTGGRACCSSTYSSTTMALSAAAAAVFASPGVSDSVETKPFRPGPKITFGKSGLKLNWFGGIYMALAIGLATFWYAGLTVCQLLYFLTRGKFDPRRRVPIEVGHLWGTMLMRLTGCYPKVTGADNLKRIHDANKGKKAAERKPVMFVANHCSWMDIYFVGTTIGWKNYKMVAKEELLKVPILGKSLRVAGHIVLDRSSRRSQLNTYKQGVKYLKEGVNLVTFPEGTRSRTGRMGPYKKGAFKMAEAVGAPIVPLTISYAHKVQPLDYIFPVRPGRCIPAGIHIGEPIPTEGKTDEVVMDEVWDTIARRLPESQKPEVGTPKSVS